MQQTQTLVCDDELERKSYILEFDPAGTEVVVKESADEFVCEAGMDIYCTTSTGTFEDRISTWFFSWIRTALTDEPTTLEVNKTDLSYTGEFSGAPWQGQCQQ